jgi:tetratricopeptide (TPR) repeat protein
MRCSFAARRPFLVSLAAAVLLAAISCSPLAAQPPENTDEELARQKQVVERFISVLERSPRRGTALDKIYGFHVESGSLEDFVAKFRERTAGNADDGAAWMILGLFESQRGRDAAAAEAFAKARELRTDDALASYYLGQSLVLVGKPDQAIAAFEEALARKPAQGELLEIFEALGRVQQRAGRTQQALDVWNRLERLFPGDVRVQEQIATSLAQEGQSAEALPRFEALASSTKDDYRRTVYRMEAAELKFKLNRSNEATADLEQLLAKLNPDSWLFREVRRRIEDVFLRTDDLGGLANYYTAWLAKNPQDIDSMARLARVLGRQTRAPEAEQWLSKALKLAPSRKELRLALIEQLMDDQRFADATEQYAELDKSDPNNPDYLRDWGKLVLRNSSRPKEERHAEAERIWRRLVAARPTDPLIATQVADLLRHAEMQPQALELYQKAVELAPASPQYLEYLGEYYHILKRTDEALATWRKMAEGPQRTATNLARLAEVLAQFGYLKQALPEIAAACELEPKDFALQLKAAELSVRGEAYDVALQALARAEQLAQNDEEREVVLNQQIKTYTVQDTLGSLANDLTAKAASGQAMPQQWFLLARYREALHEYPQATRAINEALRLEPTRIPVLATAARIGEQAGDLRAAADINRRLATVDRRGRSDYLQRVASLEAQLGRIEEALAAGRDLVAAAPGNIETNQFFADLCFRLNRTEDGFATLRRAIRLNPNETSLLLSLAAALAGQFRMDEAIEHYWQAFEREKDLDAKLDVVGKLTELYLQTNHLDRLLERLERGRREADLRRQMTICLAQAYQSAGDYGMARQELEGLLNENTRDTQLLLQLSKLAETESDFAAAAKYQEQLVRLAPGNETEYRLAALLARAGDHHESAAVMTGLAAKETDKGKLLRSIDGLLTSGQDDIARAILDTRVRENPTDWELLYRQGVALTKSDPAAAVRCFQSILGQSLRDEEPATTARMQQPRSGAGPAAYSNPLNRLLAVSQARIAVGIDRYLYSTTINRGGWMPDSHGQARMAAMGWLYRLANDAKKGDAFVAQRRERIDSPAASVRELWDWLYLQTLLSETTEMRLAARRLAELGDLSGQGEFLQWTLTPGALGTSSGPTTQQSKVDPLEPAELDLAVRSYRAIIGNLQEMSPRIAAPLLSELRRAGRGEEAERMYREILATVETSRQILTAMQVAADSEDMPAALLLLDRSAKRNLGTSTGGTTAARSDHALVASAVQRIAASKTVTASSLLDLHDHFMAYHIAWANQQRRNPLAALTSGGPPSRTAGTAVPPTATTLRRTAFAYPTANTYYDSYSLIILRQIYDQFKQQDLLSDLLKHLEQRADSATSDKVFFILGTAYVQVWSEDVEAGQRTLATAMGLVPQDDDLKLDTARLLVQSQKLDDALSLIDSITPKDQRMMQQRETLALDLAVRLNDHARAREAAQRLFGLRLDAETQVRLAGQMRRLGMDAEANAVLARTERQAGSRLSALAALMQQYQTDEKNDQAAQVAQRIIRATRTTSASQVASGVTTSESQYRSLAIQALSKAGKLKEIIAALEDQIRRTPTATHLYESLAEYYQLAGDTQKANALTAKLVELKPDDADLRYRYAQDLYRQRKLPEACEQYKVVLKKQPQLISRRYFEVVQAFQQARKESELIDLLNEIDLKSLGQPYMVTNVMSLMMRSPQSRTAGLTLFKKAWEAFPAERSRLIGYLGDDMWNLPEVVDYAKQSLRPTPDMIRRDPWYGIQSNGVSFGTNGQITAPFSRLLSAAEKAKQLDELRDEIVAAMAATPNWQSGPILLALIDSRQKKEVDFATVAQPLLDAKETSSSLTYTRWVVGQELAKSPAHLDLATKLYRLAAVGGAGPISQFQFSPGASLVRLYKQQGRNDEAVAYLREAVRKDASRNSNVVLPASLRVDSMIAIAKLFEELDAPADALTIYRDVVNDNIGASSQIIISGQPDYYKQQAQQGMQALLTRVGKRPSDVIALLSPNARASSGGSAVDLMLDLGKSNTASLRSIESPLLGVLRPASLSPDDRLRIETHITSLVQQYPRDLSVQIVAAFFAIKGSDAAKKKESLTELIRCVEQTPLDLLSPGERPNSRQRSQATQQVALWLIARECLGTPEYRDEGQKLADRSIAAAQRQTDHNQLTSILYERGRLSLGAGDRATAERQWSELIDLSLVQPRVSRAKSSAASTNDSKPSAEKRSGPVPATTSQFAVAATISQAAAVNGMPELSLRAVREAFSGGLPVADPPATSNDPAAAARARATATALAQSPNSRAADPQQQAVMELASRLWQLSAMWKQHEIPPAAVFDLFASLVFPTARPGEIVLYDQPKGLDLLTPRSIGGLLVEWAGRTDHGAELKRRVATCQATAADVTRGHLLLIELSVVERDPDSAGPHLDALAEQLEKPKLTALKQRVSQVTPIDSARPAAPAKNSSPDPP